MRSRELEEVIRPAARVTTMMWVALMASVVMYVVVAQVAIGSMEHELPPMGQEVILALIAVAAVCAVLSLVLPGKLLSDARLRERMEGEGFDPAQYLKNPQTGAVDQARVAKVRELPALEQRLATLPPLYFTPWLMGMIMAETVAIVGFALAFLTQDVEWMFLFAVVSLVLLALRRPSFDALFDRATRLARSRSS
jgi:hypothetical protein